MFAGLDADTLGGTQRVIHTLAQGLAERGHDVHVLGLHRSADPVAYVDRPAYRKHVISRGPRPGPLARQRTARLLKGLEPGYVVMVSPGVVTRLKPLLGAHRGIGQYHGSFDHARGTWHFGQVKAHYGGLDQAVFLSPDDAWRFAAEALLPNTWDIPNPLPTWPDTTVSLWERRILGVGRLAGVKRFDRLISAFARTKEPGWELHLIGDGPDEDRLRRHAVAEGVAGRVMFRGRVPADRMPAEYRAASLVAVTSEHEGLPLVLGEAASYGVPGVAFDVSGGVRLLADVLVPPADVPGFAAALERLMRDEDERCRLGVEARQRAAGFRLEPVLDRWEQLFQHISR
ncbi:glycosyltransferase [Streptosporangiaceae bacterium NEAU-GS5]|nr:glycosyltransferase [Streptosporangiaceae bacterium NEAU-GS5]